GSRIVSPSPVGLWTVTAPSLVYRRIGYVWQGQPETGRTLGNTAVSVQRGTNEPCFGFQGVAIYSARPFRLNADRAAPSVPKWPWRSDVAVRSKYTGSISGWPAKRATGGLHIC